MTIRQDGEAAEFVLTRRVNSAKDLEAVTSLWRSVYGSEFGWLSDDANPVTDGFHERSDYYVSWLNGLVPVGTMRIVRAQQMGFHITDAVDVRSLSSRQPLVVEVQRLMVVGKFRDKRFAGAPFGIYGCMVKACLHHAVAYGVDTILADCHRDMAISPLKSMKQMGFRETGDTYVDSMNGLVCVILTIDTKAWLQKIYTNQNPFNQYLLDMNDWSPGFAQISEQTGKRNGPSTKERAHA
ncbi:MULTISPECIES: hypothetical protein [unclassified Bradyrhizobium]|uniref:hypothetical protein n=1 Tax=Bradyrhizobium TaxID=374 RepID=UPI0023429B03|nr:MULTISPECIES: hypothetical protein [unclassified Bradyrhizobium]GLH80066.1 hypothetical protein SSBR45G_49750 [Bradyrhizobium sp. SSBR45G]GLH87625.1 hypothetical protein SSBR45R_50850 [Bradyrhizobium sp. SSBR45R]